MTVLDEIKKAEEKALELRHASEEHLKDLAELRQRLGLDGDLTTYQPSTTTTVTSMPKATTRRKSNGTKARKPSGNGRRRQNAPRGQRDQQVYDLIKAKPGIKVSEIAAELGMHPSQPHRNVKTLAAEGKVRKDGTAYFPVEQPTPSPSPVAPV